MLRLSINAEKHKPVTSVLNCKSLIKCRNVQMFICRIDVQMYLCVYLCHVYIRFHLEVYFSLYVSNGAFQDKLKSRNALTLIHILFFSRHLETDSTEKPAILSAFLIGKKVFYIFHSNWGTLSIDTKYNGQIRQLQIFVCLLLFKLLMCWLKYILPVAAWSGWNTVSLVSCFQNIGPECDSCPPK